MYEEIDKLIFCFDGTGQDEAKVGDYASDGEDESISNVFKMHVMFGGGTDNDYHMQVPNQRSFYYKGVGTYGGVLQRAHNKVLAFPAGDIDGIIRKAKVDLNHVDYKRDKKIYIFGFSRGAAIARIFAAKHLDGREVEFLGIFDTVFAMAGHSGWRRIRKFFRKLLIPVSKYFPKMRLKISFKDQTLGNHIKKVVHMVSVDENRRVFKPTLINYDENNPERVTEIWYPGVHSNTGGGYWHDGLSDIALKSMLDIIRSGTELTVLDLDAIDYAALNRSVKPENHLSAKEVNINPSPAGKLHKHLRGLRLFLTIITFGLAALFTLWWRRVCVDVDDKLSKDHLPVIHYSLLQRLEQVKGYKPVNLRCTRFKLLDENGKLTEKNGLSDLLD